MIIQLDMSSEIPIYMQLRNQIVMGIGKGALRIGERLPTVRQMAMDAGVNTMTVNKAYQLLKAEGFIETDRRRGGVIRPVQTAEETYIEKLEKKLELLGAEATLKGIEGHEFLSLCQKIFSGFKLREPIGAGQKEVTEC